MPMFEFKCPSCGAVKEALIWNESTPTPTCLHGQTRYMMLRQPSAPAFAIKGYSVRNGYSGTTREISRRTHGQKDMRVTVKEG